MKMTNATEVVNCLKQSVIFGNPRRIISNRRSAFTLHEFQKYCALKEIEYILTTIGMLELMSKWNE